jgi:putative transposase
VLSMRITSSRRSTGVGRLAGDQGRFPQICRSGPNPSRLGTNSKLTLQKLSSVHAQVQNHFNQERHLITRQVYKQRRSIALAELRALAT